MLLFRKPSDEPQAIPKSTGWLSCDDAVEEILPEATIMAVRQLWHRLVGEAWLGQGATIAGKKITMALCKEGFCDEWCVAADALPHVRAEAARIQDELDRLFRGHRGPVEAPPKTSKWLTHRQVANALSLDPSDPHLDAFFRDLTTTCREGRKPTLTRAKLRISACSVGGHQVWCLHTEDLRAFAAALKAAVIEMERTKPAPAGWLPLYKLAARTGLSAESLGHRWRQMRPGLYETAGDPVEMLSPADAYKVVWDTIVNTGKATMDIPIQYLKEEFIDEEERDKANDLLRELLASKTVAKLGPAGRFFEIGKIERKGSRDVPYVHAGCLERFRSVMRARASVLDEDELPSGPTPR